MQQLPNELIMLILVHAPVQTQLKCERVCKKWHQFITQSTYTASFFNLFYKLHISQQHNARYFDLYHAVKNICKEEKNQQSALVIPRSKRNYALLNKRVFPQYIPQPRSVKQACMWMQVRHKCIGNGNSKYEGLYGLGYMFHFWFVHVIENVLRIDDITSTTTLIELPKCGHALRVSLQYDWQIIFKNVAEKKPKCTYLQLAIYTANEIAVYQIRDDNCTATVIQLYKLPITGIDPYSDVQFFHFPQSGTLFCTNKDDIWVHSVVNCNPDTAVTSHLQYMFGITIGKYHTIQVIEIGIHMYEVRKLGASSIDRYVLNCSFNNNAQQQWKASLFQSVPLLFDDYSAKETILSNDYASLYHSDGYLTRCLPHLLECIEQEHPEPIPYKQILVARNILATTPISLVASDLYQPSSKIHIVDTCNTSDTIISTSIMVPLPHNKEQVILHCIPDSMHHGVVLVVLHTNAKQKGISYTYLVA